jgi:3-oxoacyl-[acyl-carrier-protein] synthase II
MSSDREVVVTGIGVVSPIGIGTEAFWQSLIDGASGVERREQFSDTDLPIKLAARIKEFDARQYIKPRKAIKIMCAPIQYGCAAAALAVEHANLSDGQTAPDRIGTLFGAETYYADPTEVCGVFRHCVTDHQYQHDRWGEVAMKQIQPLWMLKYLPNMAASHISIAIDARGASNTICQGDCSALLALIEAITIVERGLCDAVITGGTGSVCELASVLYRGHEDTSQFDGDPAKASRPFAADRDGMVLGEGSGAIVIETSENAKRRGARPLAKIKGWSRVFNEPGTKDFANGIEYGFRKTLDHAGMQASDIDWINAHADGTIKGDPLEAKAIQAVFGNTPVVAHKANFGNLGPGTAAVELVGGILALDHRVLPASINSENQDPECPVNICATKTELAKDKPLSMLKSSFSQTGQIVSVILQSP